MGLRPVFIGGCGRSGTTLLGAMLGSHPKCLTTPEAKFNTFGYLKSRHEGGKVDLQEALAKIRTHWSSHTFGVNLDLDEFLGSQPCGSYADLVLWIVEQYGRKMGKPQPAIWIDHTPSNISYANLLFELYPNAKLIHLVRDGRAVAASVMKLDWGPNTVDNSAQWWVHEVANGFAAELHQGPERVMRVRYEDLVNEPVSALQKISTFLDLDYVEDMVNGVGFRVPAFASQGHTRIGSRPDASRIGGWRSELSARQIEIIEHIAGNLLLCLGYDLLYGAYARHMTSTERLSAISVDLYRRVTNNLHRQIRRARAVAARGDTYVLKTAAQSDRL